MIDKIVVNKKRRKETYLLKNEDVYIMATSEIDGAHGIPRYLQNFTNELQQVLHELILKIIGNGIKKESVQSYSRRLIKYLNKDEKRTEG